MADEQKRADIVVGYEVVNRHGFPLMTLDRDGHAAPATLRGTPEAAWDAALVDGTYWMTRRFTRDELEREGCRVEHVVREVE